MSIEKRIRALEARLTLKHITLVMPDGSQHKIPGDGQYLLTLCCEAMRQYNLKSLGQPVPTSEHVAALTLIARHVSSDEQGAMLQLARNALTADPGDPEVNRLLDMSD